MALLVNLINEHKNANKCKRRKTKMDTAHSKQRIKNSRSNENLSAWIKKY